MAYLTLARISGDPQVLLGAYHETAEVMSGVGRDHGLIAHAAAETQDGLLIVNLWPSGANSQAAAQDSRRRAVVEHHGLEPNRLHYEHYETADYEVFGSVT